MHSNERNEAATWPPVIIESESAYGPGANRMLPGFYSLLIKMRPQGPLPIPCFLPVLPTLAPLSHLVRHAVHGAVHVIVDGHEQAKVGVHVAMVQRVEAWRVDEVLQRWADLRPDAGQVGSLLVEEDGTNWGNECVGCLWVSADRLRLRTGQDGHSAPRQTRGWDGLLQVVSGDQEVWVDVQCAVRCAAVN